MLTIHRAPRADALARALGQLLAEPPADPFTAEVVAVPTRGMERWLAQRLSGTLGTSDGRGDGICANVDFPSPAAMLGAAVAAGAGVDPDEDPWALEATTWALLDTVDECLSEPWLAPLATHLNGPDPSAPDPVRRARRLGVVRKLASLFDAYGRHRPAMVAAWAEGSLTTVGGEPLPAGQEWQGRLWQELRGRIGAPSPGERLGAACARLREAPETCDLPERLAIFNLTRIASADAAVLAALADHRDVHLFLLHPSSALWDRVSSEGHLGAGAPPRADDPTAQLAVNPLLRSWGIDSRELQLVLPSGAVDAGVPTANATDEGAPARLLARIQRDIREDRAPSPAPLAAGDDSIRVHSCHGRARQVEVLRDQLLRLLAADPTLQPRDIVVLCPDIEQFAPLIQATFGAADVSDDEVDPLPDDVRPPDLRVRLADRALRQTNPVLGAVAALLELASQRVTASQLLDLADREPVRRRFGLDDDALDRVREWTASSGVRWGLDAPHRAAYRLDAVPFNTWDSGLDRLLLGVTMNEDGSRLYERTLPLDDVPSGDIDLAGRFAELVARVRTTVERFAQPRTVAEWAQELEQATDALTASAPRDQWQREALTRLLRDVTRQAEPSSAQLSLAELRALLAERLEGQPTRANFRTGGLTVCTMHPMRSVPHRVVCVIGLDDGAFPRRGISDGDDLMAIAPHAGDRDPRTEDRQLLLDALMSATERFVVTYAGRDERTNARKPPAVPVSELLDAVDASCAGDGREAVVVEHPLQPFDARNFEPGCLVEPGPWGFDRVMLAGALAAANEQPDPPSFLAGPLPPAPGSGELSVDELVRFVQHPAKAFLRQRLGVSLGDWSTDLKDAMPVKLDSLQAWGVGDRLLQALMAGVLERDAALAEIARGTMPPGQMGKPVIDEIFPVARAIAEAARQTAPGAVETVHVRLELPGGIVLSGGITNVAGDCVRTATYSTLAAKHRLCAWVQLLALTAARPEVAYRAVTVGRKGKKVAISVIGPLGDDAGARHAAATAHLATLLDLRERGMREPLPLPCKTAAAYVQALRGNRDPVRAADSAWTTTFDWDNEDGEPEHLAVHGGRIRVADLLALPPRHDEAGDGWCDDPSRMVRYARRLWLGLLEAEDLR